MPATESVIEVTVDVAELAVSDSDVGSCLDAPVATLTCGHAWGCID